MFLEVYEIQITHYNFRKMALPSHRKNSSHMFHITEFTKNSFVSFPPLHFIHRSSSSTRNISHLSNKPFIYLPQADRLSHLSQSTQYRHLLKMSTNPEEMIGVIASQPNKLVNVFNCLWCDGWIETKLNVPIICLHFKHTITFKKPP